jgi:Na+(H+)/acetate symporter ActP
MGYVLLGIWWVKCNRTFCILGMFLNISLLYTLVKLDKIIFFKIGKTFSKPVFHAEYEYEIKNDKKLKGIFLL